jgi:cytochrome c oxidase subunit 1
MFGGAGFAFFGALHYWFGKIYGRMYHEKTAQVAFTLMFIGFNMLYFPMLILGMMGMPRRYYDYLPEFTSLNVASTVGSWILILGIIVMIVNLARSRKRGEIAPRNPWGGTTLEWQTASPPTLHNFDVEPVIPEKGPYYHGE